MILDALATFSDQQDLTALSFGTPATATSSLDMGAAGTPPSYFNGSIGGPVIHDIGRGRRIPVCVQMTVAATSAGAATLTVDLVTADDGPLSTNLTVILSSAAIAKATLVAGYRFRIGVVPKGISQRYLGIRYTVGTANLTAGKASAWLGFDDADHGDVLG